MAPGAWLWSSQLACRQESLRSGPGDASSGHHCPDLSRLSRVMLCHIHLVIIVFTSVCASTCLSWSEGRAGVLLCLFFIIFFTFVKKSQCIPAGGGAGAEAGAGGSAGPARNLLPGQDLHGYNDHQHHDDQCNQDQHLDWPACTYIHLDVWHAHTLGNLWRIISWETNMSHLFLCRLWKRSLQDWSPSVFLSIELFYWSLLVPFDPLVHWTLSQLIIW